MIRKIVAAHPNCSPRIRARLAADDDWRIREAVAAQRSTEPALLRNLATDSDRDVRAAVDRHQSTPLETLLTLSADSDHNVRSAVMANPRLMANQRQACLLSAFRRSLISSAQTERISALLSPICDERHLSRRTTWQSPHWLERFIAASHPRTPEYIVMQLAQDPHRAVSTAAEAKLFDRISAHNPVYTEAETQ